MEEKHHRAGKTLLILLLACGLVSLAAGIGVGLIMGKRALASGGKKAKHKTRPVAMVHSLGETVVNLADTGTLRYVKVTVALGFLEKVSAEKLKEYEPVLRDAVIGVFTRKRFDDLHRGGGVQKVKAEILQATARRLPDVTVAEVYLESFAMQ